MLAVLKKFFLVLFVMIFSISTPVLMVKSNFASIINDSVSSGRSGGRDSSTDWFLSDRLQADNNIMLINRIPSVSQILFCLNRILKSKYPAQITLRAITSKLPGLGRQ